MRNLTLAISCLYISFSAMSCRSLRFSSPYCCFESKVGSIIEFNRVRANQIVASDSALYVLHKRRNDILWTLSVSGDLLRHELCSDPHSNISSFHNVHTSNILFTWNSAVPSTETEEVVRWEHQLSVHSQCHPIWHNNCLHIQNSLAKGTPPEKANGGSKTTKTD